MQLKNSTLYKTQSFINGAFVDSKSGKTFSVQNPYNGEVIGELADCGAEDTEHAIQAASEAFKVWKNYSAGKRARILKNGINCS